jgi:hypothetical protein
MSLLRTNLLKGTFGGGSTPQWKGSTFQILASGQQLYGVAAFQTGVQASVPWQLYTCTNSTTVGTMIASGSATPDGRYGWYTADLSSVPINLPMGYYLLAFQQGSGYVIGNALTDGIAQSVINAQFNGYDGATAPTTGQTISGNVGPYNHEIILATNGVSQTLAPSSLPTETSLTGSVTAIQDNPQSPDANWLTANAVNSDVAIQAAFPVPSAIGNSGLVGSQNFEVLVRRSTNGTTVASPIAQIAVRISGSTTNIITGHTLTLADDNTHILTLAFDPANYTSSGVNADGSNLQIYVSGTHAGTTSTKARSVDIGAVRYYAQGQQAGPTAYTKTFTDSFLVNDPNTISKVDNLHMTLATDSMTVGDNPVTMSVGHVTVVTLPVDSISASDSGVGGFISTYGKMYTRTLTDSMPVADSSIEYVSKTGGGGGTGVETNGLIAYYNSNQGVINTTWQNLASTGSKYDVTLVNGPTRTANGMLFTAGSSQWAYLTTPSELSNSSATLEFRMNITNANAEPDIFSSGADTSGVNDTYNIFPGTDGTTLYVEPSGNALTFPNVVVNNVDIWITVVLNTSVVPSTLTLYKNGQKVGNAVTTSSTNILANQADGYLNLTDASFPIDGILDNLKIYNVALNDTQVLANYNNGTAVGLGSTSAVYNVELNDTMSIADTNATAQYTSGGPVTTKTYTDPITVGDNPVTTLVAHYRTLVADSISIADTPVTKQSSRYKTLTADSVTVADTTITKQSSRYKTLTADSVTVADTTITKQSSRYKTLTADSVTVADNSIAKQSSFLKTLSIDSVTVADTTITKQSTFIKTLSADSVVAADTPVSKQSTFIKTLNADSVNVADVNVTKQSSFRKTLSVDSVGFADTPLTHQGTYSRTLTVDSLLVADSNITKQSSFLKTLNADSVGVADNNISKQATFPRTLTADSITSTDTPVTAQSVKYYTLTLPAESIVISDGSNVTKQSSFYRTLNADSVGVADSNITTQSTLHRTLNADSIGVADNPISVGSTNHNSITLPVESITVADNNIAKQSTLYRTLTADSVSVADNSIAKVSTLHLTLAADSISVADTNLTKQTAFHKTLTVDSVVSADSNITTLSTLHRTLSADSIVVADNPISSGSTNHNVITLPADSILIADSNVAKQTAFGRTLSVDSVVVADTNITKQSTLHRTLSADSITVADVSITKQSTLHKTLSADSVSVADNTISVGSTNNHAITLPADSIGVADSVSKQFAISRVLTVDSLSVQDSTITKQSILHKTLNADSVGFTDSLGHSLSVHLPADSVGIADGSQTTHAVAKVLPVDSVGFIDSISKITGLHETLTDPIGFNDSLTYKGPTHATLTLTDSIGFNDNISLGGVFHHSLTLTDSIGFSDNVYQGSVLHYNMTLTDSIGFTENVAKGIGRKVQTDSIGALDAITKKIAYLRTLSDTAPTSDSIASKSAFHVTLRDSIQTTDGVSKGTSRVVSDTFSLDEGFASVSNSGFVDSVRISDSLSIVKVTYLTFKDEFGMKDSASYGAEIHPLAKIYLNIIRSDKIGVKVSRSDVAKVNISRTGKVNLNIKG